jgi:4-amino-4-deoxy-L-arabinose transferase-like glycosyltransferase
VTEGRLRWSLGIGVTFVSAVVVWTVFNPTPHSGGDNSGYVGLAHGMLVDGTYTDVFDPEGRPHTKYPPLFPAVLAVLMALGARTWASLKLAAALPTVMAVTFTYLWAERRLGAAAAACVALLLALSSGVVYYSQWILSDPLFLALTIGALWALERAEPGAAPRGSGASPLDERGGGGASAAGDDRVGERSRLAWLALGVVLTGFAYFTRSAGLPLIVALLATLAASRQWARLGLVSAALGLPMIVWAMRGRGDGVAQYGTEFWMVDPYQPALGTIGPFGLVPRILENLSAYVLQHGPAGVVGADGPALGFVGVGLATAAVGGWVVSLRREIRVAEIFFPLYAGLILVWPAVWGGDRFALPLYPLAFLFGVVALRALASRLPGVVANAIAVGAFLLLLLPATGHWLDARRELQACAALSDSRGPWACYGAGVEYFAMAAAWTARNLPQGEAVFTRKPRHFYVLSGHPSRAFPFVEDPQVHLDLADRIGVRYVLLDQWDGLAGRYVGGAVRQWPGAFCYMGGFGEPAQGGAQLLGILPPDQRPRAAAGGGEGVGIAPCPESYYARSDDRTGNYSSSGRIPLLDDLDS